MAGNTELVSLLLTLLLGGTMMLGLMITLLLLKSDLGLSKWLLAVTLVALVTHLLTFLLFITQVINQWPHLLGITYPIIFLTGPAFYFFIRTYAEPAFRFKIGHLVHLLPATLIFGLMIPTYLAPISEKLALIRYYYELAPTENLSAFEWLYLNLYVVVILVYVIAALRYVYRQHPNNAKLLKKFCWLFLALSVLYLVLQSGFILSGASLITSEIILSALMALVILTLGYWILDIRQLFPKSAKGKYRTSPLSQEAAIAIEQALNKAMNQQEVYLNPRLRISDMAQLLQVPSHHLSQVLNDRMNTNFYQLVNRYRIERCKQILNSDRIQQVSIQGIGFDCGFSNKTSFYRAFKKQTGMTPAQYLATLGASPKSQIRNAQPETRNP